MCNPLRAYILMMTLCASLSPMLKAQGDCGENTEFVLVPGGEYRPFMRKDTLIFIDSFYLDKYPVTNEQYYTFVKNNPQWNRKNIKALFADDSYLQHWDETPSNKQMQSPVSNISWYAANAYCECQGKRLPSMYEWEYAASFDLKDPNSGEKTTPDKIVLEWYSSANPKLLPPIKSTYKNELGIYDIHGLIWEWVQDFNSVMLPNDARNQKELEKFYCAAGSIGATDPSDYASFLRFGLRSSLKANYTLKNLGFRCAKDKK